MSWISFGHANSRKKLLLDTLMDTIQHNFRSHTSVYAFSSLKAAVMSFRQRPSIGGRGLGGFSGESTASSPLGSIGLVTQLHSYGSLPFHGGRRRDWHHRPNHFGHSSRPQAFLNVSTSEHIGTVGNYSIVPVTWTGPIDGSGVNVTIKANDFEQVYHKAREINPDFGQTAPTVNTNVESFNVESRSLNARFDPIGPKLPAVPSNTQTVCWEFGQLQALAKDRRVPTPKPSSGESSISPSKYPAAWLTLALALKPPAVE
ncbi:hypothetical protein LTS18_011757 [Coniosporium uncinatum]|uniref:Uncharacterized protein n=1 Tax=Coniosporium uncinatum TaxID=93489 RepID=A0ACC3DCC8_9PEZI|nr:hypothetical protein LTS18_011757 [Coniosporium uncinatum]